MQSSNLVKISAAGSGKTWDVCHDSLSAVSDGQSRALIVTYTHRGVASVKRELALQNQGAIPSRVDVKTWYEFLLSDMIKPYQSCLVGINGTRGLDFSSTYGQVNYGRRGARERYVTSSGNVRSNQASELAVYLNTASGGKPIARLERIYQSIYFDEIQDLAGYDIDIIKLLIESNVAITCCGDNKQATFSTHNAKKNKKKTGRNVWAFFAELAEAGKVEVQRNLVSRRFNSEICEFANEIFPEGDSISTMMEETTQHDGVYLIQADTAMLYCGLFSPVVLRYDKNTHTEFRNTVNFGACKGDTFERVLILPNGPLKNFILTGKALSSPEKYYVAVTRPRYSIAICLENLPDTLSGFSREVIEQNGVQIPCLKRNKRESL